MLIKIFYILIFLYHFDPYYEKTMSKHLKKYITSYDNINYLISIPPPKGPITKKKELLRIPKVLL